MGKYLADSYDAALRENADLKTRLAEAEHQRDELLDFVETVALRVHGVFCRSVLRSFPAALRKAGDGKDKSVSGVQRMTIDLKAIRARDEACAVPRAPIEAVQWTQSNADRRALLAYVDELRAQILGFPNLTMMREAMVATADENKALRAELAALKAAAGKVR